MAESQTRSGSRSGGSACRCRSHRRDRRPQRGDRSSAARGRPAERRPPGPHLPTALAAVFTEHVYQRALAASISRLFTMARSSRASAAPVPCACACSRRSRGRGSSGSASWHCRGTASRPSAPWPVRRRRRPCVVELVGGRHEVCVVMRSGLQVLHVALLALAPPLLLRRVRGEAVRALTHDPLDPLAELLLDLVEPGLAAVIFGDVVQERGGGLAVGAAVLEHQRGDAEHVGEVRDVASLAFLVAMVVSRGPMRRSAGCRCALRSWRNV